MPAITHWTEHITYRIEHDCDMAKISGFDERCQEHWLLIPHVMDRKAKDYKPYGERRADALESIQDSIERGDPPGRVTEDLP